MNHSDIRAIFALIPAAVRHRCFLAGGAIRSMFDGTPVKDYDLFFRNVDDFEEACQEFSKAHLQGTEGSDGYPTFYALGYPTFYALGHPIPFNLIGFRFGETAEQLIETFDFRCTAMAVSMDADGFLKFHACPGAINDAMNQVVTPLNRQSDERITKRVQNYARRGYRRCSDWDDRINSMPITGGGY